MSEHEHGTKLKAFTVRIAEMALSVGLVAVFFLLFMAILGRSFPQGTGLRDLLLFEENADLGGHGGLDLSLETGGEDMVGFVARLTDVSRRVKDKRANAISWQDARMGIKLENRHAVQTFGRSGATIAFDESNALQLGENSLVIIRRLEQTQDFAEKRASVVMLGGELEGSVADGPAEAMELEIVTPSAVSRIRSVETEPTDFKIVTHDDDSSSIAIYSGSAEVTVGGKTMLIPSNHVINVDADGRFAKPVAIPAVPSLLAPATRSAYAYRSVPPEVSLNWEPVAAARDYRVQIARDEGFKSLVLDKVVESTELVHGNLTEGRYFWRVRGRNAGAESPVTAARLFDVVHDEVPPGLEVQLPGPEVSAERFVLKGTTDPDARVFVGREAVPVSATGEFTHDLTLARGINVLVVEAFDPAGNAAYVSKLVHARF